uniref:Uncharacterized protein n=1 Tax=Picea sitchensis TaxID=3332 RepID=A9NQJ4_PICSI|nr:unknown [Picea sitchensis]
MKEGNKDGRVLRTSFHRMSHSTHPPSVNPRSEADKHSITIIMGVRMAHLRK